nr:hypothetical protein [Nitrosomonas nitrosa]
MKKIKKAILSGLLGFAFFFSITLAATAATLGLTTQNPSVGASSAIIDFFEFGADGDLSTFGWEIDTFNNVIPDGFAEFSFGIGFSLANPTVDASGGFNIFDETGLFLGGDLAAVGFTEDVIEFQFNNLVGSAATDFGSSALLLVHFDESLGLNPFNELIDGMFYTASVSITSVLPQVVTMPVSEPAALPMVAMALLLMGYVRMRQ